MAVRSTTEQAQSLLERRVAQAKVRGTIPSDVEAYAIIESISQNLLFNPRAALLFAILAKNGLRAAVVDELAAIDSLKKDLADLGNPSFSITDTRYLTEARNALTQLSQLDGISTTSAQYKKFDTSISNFLNKTISRGLRKPGATELTRPGTEAAIDLTTDYASLVDLHTDVLDRLYALAVGIENFVNSPLSTILGTTTVARAQSDLAELLEYIGSEGTTPADRDMVIRLITNRAAIKTTGTLPDIQAPVLSTNQSLPLGYSVKAVSDPSSAIATSVAGPFTLPANSQMTVSVNGSTLGPVRVPQANFDLNNQAFITSSQVSFPVVIPSNYYLFVLINGAAYAVSVTANPAATKAALISDLNAKFLASADAPVQSLKIDEFIASGTNRFVLRHPTATSLRLTNIYVMPPSAYAGATVFGAGTLTNSIHALIGFDGTELGTSGATQTEPLLEAIQWQFSPLVTPTRLSTDAIELRTVATTPGTSMTVTAPSVTSLSGTYKASSDSLKLYGSINGTTTDPVSPVGLLNIGDSVEIESGTAAVQSVTATRIILSAPLPTADGAITVDSALRRAYANLQSDLDGFLPTWLRGWYAKNLEKLGLALSTVGQGALQSQVNTALDFLSTLESSLLALKTLLESPTSALAATSAQAERAIVNGITATLEERKFDRALSLLLRCKIYEALSVNSDTASFGGAFLSAAATFAQTDLVVPNRAIDEGVESKVSQPIRGL